MISPYQDKRPINRRPMGSTLNRPGRVRMLLEGKLRPPKWSNGWWWGIAYDWFIDVNFRVISPEWLPIGVVLVCDHRTDLDCFIINVEQTILENGLADNFRDFGPGKEAITLPLF